MNDPNSPSILNNPHLTKNPIYGHNEKIRATLKMDKEDTITNRFKKATEDRTYNKIYEKKKNSALNSQRNSRKSSRRNSISNSKNQSLKKLNRKSSNLMSGTLPKFDSLHSFNPVKNQQIYEDEAVRSPLNINPHLSDKKGNNEMMYTTEDYNLELGNRISNLLLKDFTRLLDIYLDDKISQIGDLEQIDPKNLKFELSELILKKVSILMEAIEQGNLRKWLGSLGTSKSNVIERDFFTKIKKLFERMKFIVGGSEETIIERKDLRNMSQLFLDVSYNQKKIEFLTDLGSQLEEEN